MVPSRAVFRSGCACFADLRVQCAIFVEETAVDCLIKSVPLAGWPLLANADAVLEMWGREGCVQISLTLVRDVALPCRAPKMNKRQGIWFTFIPLKHFELTLAGHWCNHGRGQCLDVQCFVLCRCNLQRESIQNDRAPMTTTCSHHFFHRTCDRTRHCLQLQNWPSTPGWEEKQTFKPC